MLTQAQWVGFTAQQQQVFMTITADATALGVSLKGLSVTSITIAGQGGSTQTELNLAGNTTDLVNFLNGGASFTSRADDGTVGAPHPGYDGNYRQNRFRWSMQINTNANGAQIDIDLWNPAFGLAGMVLHGAAQWLPNKLTKSDTDYTKAANALHLGVPTCSGN